MAALTLERLTRFAGLVPARGTFPIAANVRIFKGSMVAIDVSGRARPAGTIASGALSALGKASATYDNRTGSELGGGAAAVDVEVEYGVFAWTPDVTDPPTGPGVVFMVDDQTVSDDNDTDARGIAGFVSEINNGRAYVWMGPHIVGMIAIAASEAAQLDTAQTDIAALEVDALSSQAFVHVPIKNFSLAANGAPLIVFDDGVADGLDYDEGQSYRFNPGSTAAIGVTVPMPPDLDATEDVVLHMLASRVGADDTTAAVTVAAFFQTVGAAHDADANAGGATGAAAGATTVVSELTRTILAANVPAAPCALSFSLVPTGALDADDLRIHAVWIEYTRALRVS